MSSVGGEADPLQRRVRTLVPEPTRLAQPESPKRGCAATMESIAGSTGRACASGTLGMRIGMGDCMKPNVEVQWLRSNPLQCRVRGAVLEPASVAQPGSEKRGSAATTKSIAGSTGRACVSGTLGVNFGMGDCKKPNV